MLSKRRLAPALIPLFLASLAAPALADAPEAGEALHRTLRYVELGASADWPQDLRAPDSRTLWRLGAAGAGDADVVVTIEARAGEATVTEVRRRGDDRVVATRVLADPAGGPAAVEWLAPDRRGTLLRLGETRSYDLTERRGARTDELHVTVTGIGTGWAELPAGPHEVVVERSVVLRRPVGVGAYSPDAVVTRWIDPRRGVVAETRVPAPGSPTVAGGGSSESGMLLADSPEAHGTLAIDESQIDTSIRNSIQFGWNRADMRTSTTVNVSDVTADGSLTTAADLIAASSWDFSVNTSANALSEIASTIVPLDTAHTCNAVGPSCGYQNTGGNRVLARQDDDFDDSLQITNTVYERETQMDKVVVWQRAGAQREGVPGAFGNGETRFCYDPSFSATTRSAVAQWEFASDGSGNFVMQSGDTWETQFFCEQVLFAGQCNQFNPVSYAQACSNGPSGINHSGKQSTEVLKEGVVTLPSGHHLNTLLVRITADFCVYSVSGCGNFFLADEVRKFVYLWVAPEISTVVRMQSANLEPDETFTTFEETDVKFGLFPPLSIAATGVTDTSVTLDWNPGNDTHRIDRYKVYWDTVSGSTSGGAYAFDSDTDATQVSFNGTEATISGLTPGQDYYFTVTSLYTHTDAMSGVMTEYESLLFPTQVFGDPNFSYPSEVLATTTCTPAQEVSGLTIQKVGGQCQLCWTPSADACVVGYDVLGSDDPTSAAFFSTLAQVGQVSCWTASPTEIFYLIVGRGSGGQGPWGHYGQ